MERAEGSHNPNGFKHYSRCSLKFYGTICSGHFGDPRNGRRIPEGFDELKVRSRKHSHIGGVWGGVWSTTSSFTKAVNPELGDQASDMYVHMPMYHVCICIYMFIFLRAYMHIYICTYTHMYHMYPHACYTLQICVCKRQPSRKPALYRPRLALLGRSPGGS